MAHRQRTGIAAATQSVITDDPDFLWFIVERVVHEVLEAEMTAHLHAEPYERRSERRGYRNGYKPRQLNTRIGTLTLQVPQDRVVGQFDTFDLVTTGPNAQTDPLPKIGTEHSPPNSSRVTSAARRRSCWH